MKLVITLIRDEHHRLIKAVSKRAHLPFAVILSKLVEYGIESCCSDNAARNPPQPDAAMANWPYTKGEAK